MNQSMIIAAVSMGQLQQKLDTIANNIANSNTTGFKSRDVQFSDLLYEQINNQTDQKNEVGRLTPNGIRVGSGARIGTTLLNLNMGPIKQTERMLDIAILHPSYLFQIRKMDANGNESIEYTRDGAFYLSPDPTNRNELELVNADGDQVIGTNGPITIPADYKEINIGQNGNISVTLKNGVKTSRGKLALVEAIHPQMLLSIGHNFQSPANVPLNQVLRNVNDSGNIVKQGALEMSNVNSTDEMTELINMQRSYQFNARSISMADQMMGLVNGLR
ncbi:flagellar hook-basal body protein [Fictibacillus gelatini]|uniref:flagellar hook-basal body protein n=1 Tax=Fictibacillus gelatini TaxID=225985 RepID=UPI00042454A2|nr:flagellar hook-basal body protein [Fictibacillus gelatini]